MHSEGFQLYFQSNRRLLLNGISIEFEWLI